MPGILEIKPQLSVTVNTMWSIAFYNKMNGGVTAGNTATGSMFYPSRAKLTK